MSALGILGAVLLYLIIGAAIAGLMNRRDGIADTSHDLMTTFLWPIVVVIVLWGWALDKATGR